VVSRLIGHLGVGGTSRRVLLAKVTATCQISGSPCVTQKSKPANVTRTVTLKLQVRKGVRYGISVGATAQVVGTVQPPKIMGSVAGDACVSGYGIACAQAGTNAQSSATLEITRVA
jgi:hypothetical protein